MTTVLDRFKDFYPDEWREVLEFFVGRAYFYSSPTALVCAYPTLRSLVEQKKYEMVIDNFDTWYIHYLAGEVTEVFDIAPHVTKWICWQRNQSGKDVFIEYEKLRRRYGKQTESTKDSTDGRGSAARTAADHAG